MSVIHDLCMSVIQLDVRLRCWNVEYRYSTYSWRIDHDDGHIPFLFLCPEPVENSMQPDHPVPLTFPQTAPTSPDAREIDAYISTLSTARRDMPTNFC